MDAYQNSQINMLRAVEGICDSHADAWSTLGVFAESKERLSANLVGITEAIALQGTGTEGATTQKSGNRLAVTTDLLSLAPAVRLFSVMAGNQKQAKESTITASDLDDMGGNEFLGFATRIEGMAKLIGANDGLKPYQWPTTAITAFSARLDTYRVSMDDPSHARAESSRGTADLVRLTAESMTLLKERMDVAIELLKATQPAFYTEYWIAREIIDPGYATRALTVTVTDEATGLPVADTKATITPGNTAKTTGPAGRFYVQTLEPGDYIINFSKNGYKASKATVSIAAGEGTTTSVSLQPDSPANA